MRVNHYVVRLALEFWRASGERSAARLQDLVGHLAGVYGFGESSIPSLKAEALVAAGFGAEVEL